jgi:hypothetical protein
MADDAGNATTTGAAGCASATAGSCCASVAACRGSTVDVAGPDPEASAAPREAPLAIAAVLAPVRGAVDERHLVGTDASALSTLAGASWGTVGATLRTWKQIVRPPPVGHATPGKATPYLKEEKARFLFLEVPADIMGAAGAAADAPPATSTARGLHSTRRRLHRARGRLRGARWHLRGSYRLCRRLPGGGRLCVRPRRWFSCHRSRLR